MCLKDIVIKELDNFVAICWCFLYSFSYVFNYSSDDFLNLIIKMKNKELRSKAVQELIKTEESYLRQLETLQKVSYSHS